MASQDGQAPCCLYLTSHVSQVGEVMNTDALQDLELLSLALKDAMDAHGAGVLIGPPLDTVAWARAKRRARRADAARVRQTVRDRPAVITNRWTATRALPLSELLGIDVQATERMRDGVTSVLPLAAEYVAGPIEQEAA